MAELWEPPRVASGIIGALADLRDFFRRGGMPAYCLPRRVSSATTLLSTDRLLLADTSGGAFTVTLGSARNYPAQLYAVKLIAVAGANNVTLDADGTENIYTTAAAGTLAWNTAGMTKLIWPCLITAPATWGWVELNT